jgi:toxin-antitoxin system PIN domain toxin
MLLDANILLYASDAGSPQHQPAAALLTSLMNGTRRVGLPWQTIGAFVRISTNPRAYVSPATGPEAWSWVEGWLARDVAWIPPATEATARVYGQLCSQLSVTGNLVPDAMLAALAIEHGLELWSTDTDFARFPGLRWRNPLTTG